MVLVRAMEVQDSCCAVVGLSHTGYASVGQCRTVRLSDCRTLLFDSLTGLTLATHHHRWKQCRTAVGHCRTVGLSDCRTLSDCRSYVGVMSESYVGLSYRGSKRSSALDPSPPAYVPSPLRWPFASRVMVLAWTRQTSTPPVPTD